MFNNIIEKRTVNDGLHSLVLEIAENEYKQVYDEYNDEIASKILNHHLVNRGDDGRPTDVQIHHESDSNIVKISANIHYLGNSHTTYGIH
ncbi:hypothetical protein KQI42_04540 [Tissierella sp. MSJ-40]|uniref:Uncharacterized protein n=1 Tax=Tissierella simiarum TaxID=2841534 RepID=A0ABS6E2Z3_9FIRM|nr:hypothetical protein [Tissierella simiarum]MBU5437264.1 hypothetical protein [Tissierella simiarum]